MSLFLIASTTICSSTQIKPHGSSFMDLVLQNYGLSRSISEFLDNHHFFYYDGTSEGFLLNFLGPQYGYDTGFLGSLLAKPNGMKIAKYTDLYASAHRLTEIIEGVMKTPVNRLRAIHLIRLYLYSEKYLDALTEAFLDKLQSAGIEIVIEGPQYRFMVPLFILERTNRIGTLHSDYYNIDQVSTWLQFSDKITRIEVASDGRLAVQPVYELIHKAKTNALKARRNFPEVFYHNPEVMLDWQRSFALETADRLQAVNIYSTSDLSVNSFISQVISKVKTIRIYTSITKQSLSANPDLWSRANPDEVHIENAECDLGEMKNLRTLTLNRIGSLATLNHKLPQYIRRLNIQLVTQPDLHPAFDSKLAEIQQQHKNIDINYNLTR